MKYGILILILTFYNSFNVFAQEHWKAPLEADDLGNIYQLDDQEVIEKGKTIYSVLCASCHGTHGDGSGGAGQASNPPPSDFTKDLVQEQTDGALFWKVWEGNPPDMLSYKNILSEEEVWQLVVYLRQFAND